MTKPTGGIAGPKGFSPLFGATHINVIMDLRGVYADGSNGRVALCAGALELMGKSSARVRHGRLEPQVEDLAHPKKRECESFDSDTGKPFAAFLGSAVFDGLCHTHPRAHAHARCAPLGAAGITELFAHIFLCVLNA